MATPVHLVGSVGLDTVDEVFATVGGLLGPHLRRVPDGEPGGRRLWITWQYPLLRASPFLQVDGGPPSPSTGLPLLRVADGVKPEEVRFGELGYAREARASYQDFLAARERGDLPPRVRFQVCLPTAYAVIMSYCPAAVVPAVLPAYEQAMIREAETVCAAIPHRDLAIQWDVCQELLTWDGGWARARPFPGIERQFGDAFRRMSQAVPAAVELGFHLCYGDFEGRHFVEPKDSAKMVELANLVFASVGRPIAYVHMPVPIGRDDDAYFAPLRELRLPPGTELYLGLVHARDGVAGTARRMAAARKFVRDFGIGSECGIARARKPDLVREILRVHADAAKSATA
jgi:hypothetical protein